MDTKNKLLKVNGIIIAETDYREYDKLLTILTKELGKISVYAFGIRKPNSKSIGKARLFTYGTFEIRLIKGNYQLEGIILKKSFDELSDDFDINCYASYFVELASFFEYENIECDDIVNLLIYAFKALIKADMSFELIRRVYELKMLQYEGLYKESTDIDTDNKTVIYTWDYILKRKPEKLFNFTLDEKVFNIFDRLMFIEMKENVSHKFKSLMLLGK